MVGLPFRKIKPVFERYGSKRQAAMNVRGPKARRPREEYCNDTSQSLPLSFETKEVSLMQEGICGRASLEHCIKV